VVLETSVAVKQVLVGGTAERALCAVFQKAKCLVKKKNKKARREGGGAEDLANGFLLKQTPRVL